MKTQVDGILCSSAFIRFFVLPIHPNAHKHTDAHKRLTLCQ